MYDIIVYIVIMCCAALALTGVHVMRSFPRARQPVFLDRRNLGKTTIVFRGQYYW